MEELIELLCRPWALLPDRLAEVTASLVAALNGREQFTAGPVKGAPKPKPRGVAVIPIQGVITPRLTWGSSVRDIRAQFREALADDNVASILFEVDSPGGSVYGIDELSREIHQARGKKPIVALTNSLAASAAYYLASSADEFYATPTGETGSIGVYAAHVDVSQALEKEGVKVTMISAGKYKTEGNPYEPLTDEARAWIQKSVDQYYQMFVSSVARNRSRTVDDVLQGFGQGRVLGALDATREGLVDGIKTFDETLGQMLQNIQKSQPNSIFQVRYPGPPPEPLIAD